MLHPTSFIALVAGIMASSLVLHAQDAKSKPADSAQPLKGTVKVSLETSKGNIELELDADKAPKSVANFVKYVKKGFYDGTVFHRVMPGFMIQGGGYGPDMKRKETDPPIENECKNGLKNLRGTIAMARTNNPDSATSEFFINVANNAGLDYPMRDDSGYAVFGKVTKGMDVCDAIVNVPTAADARGEKSKPLDPPVLKKASIAQ